MMIKAVLFDLDDTLYEEKQFVMSGFKAISQYLSKEYNFNQEEIFKILKSDFENGLRKKNFDILLEKLNLKEEGVDALVKIYREHLPTLSLYPDAEVILRNFKNKFKLGLITDGYPIVQKNKISALNIKYYFNIVILNDISGNRSKAHTLPFEDAVRKLNVKPGDAIYVGDNPLKDFISAKKIGMHTVRIKRETGEYNKIIVDKSLDADYTISNLSQLLQIIEKCKKLNHLKGDKYEKTI